MLVATLARNTQDERAGPVVSLTLNEILVNILVFSLAY